MSKKNFNLKNMIETYKNANGDMETCWETFRNMYYMGFMEYETWVKFYDTCKDWYFDAPSNTVRRYGDDSVVYQLPTREF